MESTLNEKEIKLFSFEKANSEQVRGSETVFHGNHYFDLRIFTKLANGDYVPTKKGITINMALLPSLKEELNKI